MKGCDPELKILSRVLRWRNNGIEYEPDARHVQTIIKDLKLEKSKPVVTPGIQESEVEEVEDSREEWQTDTMYRAIAARLNYLALDRPDLQFASKSASQHMSQPNALGWRKLKRIGKYLLKHGRTIQWFPFEAKVDIIRGDGDSDWAGERKERKSTSGGVLRIDTHVIKTWSSTQQTVSLSSAESELYAMTKTAAQAIGLSQILNDFGESMEIRVHSDSSAALAIGHRERPGRTRHIQVQYSWLQQEFAEGRIKINKVPTHSNVADVLTKHLRAETLLEHI